MKTGKRNVGMFVAVNGTKHKKRKNRIKIVGTFILSVILFVVMICGACSAGSYTENEHLQRVSDKVQKRYIESGKFESFSVRALYDEHDQLKYFVVDFEPTGFLYVRIRDGNFLAGCGNSMYTTNLHIDQPVMPWQRFTVQKIVGENGEISYENKYETDENGEYIFYYKSCYKMAQIDNEKLYLLKTEWPGYGGYLPAVKRGKEFINLISMQRYDETISEVQPVFELTFILEWDFNL